MSTKDSSLSSPAPETPQKESQPIIFDQLENPMLAQLSKKHPLRPAAFELLLQPLRMATMVQPLQGAKVDFSAGLSQRLQFTNSWNLSHGQGGSYDVTMMFVGGKLATPYEMIAPNPFLMARYVPGAGRQDIKMIAKLQENVEFKFSANYMSSNPRESHIQLETEYLGKDFIVGTKWGLGLEFFTFNYIQTLTKNLVAGFELMNMRKPRQMTNLSFGLKYTMGNSALYMQYLAPQQLLHIGNTIKGNPNITFTTELLYNGMGNEVDFIGGISVRFLKAKFNAQLNGSGKLNTCLHHAINPFAKLTLSGEADFFKQEQKFGISLSLGDISH